MKLLCFGLLSVIMLYPDFLVPHKLGLEVDKSIIESCCGVEEGIKETSCKGAIDDKFSVVGEGGRSSFSRDS